MSNTPLVPKEKLSAYQRWELHSFDPRVEEKVVPKQEDQSALTATKIAQAQEQSYQAGYAAGASVAAKKSAADSQALQALITRLASQSAALNQAVADDLVALALEIARQMVRQALVVHPELIVPVVQDAWARVPKPYAQPTLLLHPADAVLIREHSAEIAIEECKIIEDASVARGGCVLQTAANHIDATTGTRWQKLAAALGQNISWLD